MRSLCRKLTFAAEDDGQIPELGHVERFKNLTLVGGTITIQGQSDVVLAFVLVGKGDSSSDWNLSTYDAVSTIETSSKHVHGTTLSKGNTLSSSEQFSDDGFHGAATHEGEAVTSVRRDEVVFFRDSMFDSDSDGFLSGGEMAKPSDLLFLV